MTISLDAIALPGDMRWEDEYKWTPVKQSIRKSISGAQVITEAAQLKGRPITLIGEGEWATKQTLESLRVKEAVVDQVMTLDIDGTTYSVQFSRTNGLPIEAEPVVDYYNPDLTDHYTLKLRFITV